MGRKGLWLAAPRLGSGLIAALAMACFGMLAYAHPAAAANPNACSTTSGAFVVTTGNDGTQQGTLRWAITCANATVVADTIGFDSSVTLVKPTSLLPTVTQPLVDRRRAAR